MEEHLPVIGSITSETEVRPGYNVFDLNYLAEVGLPTRDGQVLKILDIEGNVINKAYVTGVSRNLRDETTHVTIRVFE
jgi:hypothetical protein